MGFFRWVFLGGFFNANPAYPRSKGSKKHRITDQGVKKHRIVDLQHWLLGQSGGSSFFQSLVKKSDVMEEALATGTMSELRGCPLCGNRLLFSEVKYCYLLTVKIRNWQQVALKLQAL